MTSPATPLYKRLLLTGAAGGLGRALRPRLTARCEVLRVSDLADLGAAQPGEEVQQVALQDRAAVLAREIASASITHAPWLSKSWQTVLLPLPMPPVRPNRSATTVRGLRLGAECPGRKSGQ